MNDSDPDAFRVDDPPQTSGVIHGHVQDDWPRFKPEELRNLLRAVWTASAAVNGDVVERENFVLDAVPYRDWENHGANV